MEHQSHNNHQWSDDRAEKFIEAMENQIETRYEPFARKIAKTWRKYKTKQNPTILDIGCGPAFLLMELQKIFPNSSLIGIDSSELMVSLAKKKIEEYNLSGIDIKIGKAEDIPLPDNYQTIITSLNSFHDFQDARKTLNEVFRVLEKGGFFILKDKNRSYSNWRMRINNFFLRIKLGRKDSKRYKQNPSHWLDPYELRSWMTGMGFSVKFLSKKVNYIILGIK